MRKPISCRPPPPGRSTGCSAKFASNADPGYLLLSTDVARFETEPPNAPLPHYAGGTSPRALALFTEAASTLIADHQLTVLADLLVHRLNAVDKLEALLAADVVPHATLMWGKSLVDESAAGVSGHLRRRGQRRIGPRGNRRGTGSRDRGRGVHRHGQRVLQSAHRPGPDHRHRVTAEHGRQRGVRTAGDGRGARRAHRDPHRAGRPLAGGRSRTPMPCPPNGPAAISR